MPVEMLSDVLAKRWQAVSHPPQHAVSQMAGETCCDEPKLSAAHNILGYLFLPIFFPSFLNRWLDSPVETMALMHVNVMTMPLCSVQLPVGHAVLHGIF